MDLLCNCMYNLVQFLCRSRQFFFFVFFCLWQVSQWHPRAHEGSGDGLAQTVPESRDPVSEWWGSATQLLIFGFKVHCGDLTIFLMHLLILTTWWSYFTINNKFSIDLCFICAVLTISYSCFFVVVVFLTGHYDKCVFTLREENKGDMANVLNYIFSHAQVTKKNLLVTMLIVSFCFTAYISN